MDMDPEAAVHADLGCAAVGEVIYAIGGCKHHNPVVDDTVEAFDTVAAKWDTLPRTPTARYALVVTLVKTALYAVGGEVDGNPCVTGQEFCFMGGGILVPHTVNMHMGGLRSKRGGVCHGEQT